MRGILLGAAALALAACSTTSTQDTISVLQELKKGCHVTANIQGSAGAINPTSGISFGATADCPAPTTTPPPPASNAVSP